MNKKNKPYMVALDPYLEPFEDEILQRISLYKQRKKEITGKSKKLYDVVDRHEYFGFHKTEKGWVYREWAPSAEKMYLTGDFNGWDVFSCPMQKRENGIFEIVLNDCDSLRFGQRVQAIVQNGNDILRRVPIYATRVVQDPDTFLWCAELEDTYAPFEWCDGDFVRADIPIIYECHIGMAQEKGDVGSYREFTENILPRIKAGGYNTLQIMAVMEHPYYASFGYQVTSFFAASSRYGESRDLKVLINTAHNMGLAVLLDVVHSHTARNTNEGMSSFDGGVYPFFHSGDRGEHVAWGTKLFDYGKKETLLFLLSNLRFWMETFHFDGFRFDGVTSMIYRDHGLGREFLSYDAYFSDNTDKDAVIYLQLANELIHGINKKALTIAEEMSGMPGMCLPVSRGGMGFDYRLSMGVPDMWIRIIKEKRDEDWDMWELWYELTQRRPKEKNIGYSESHDQALVGDKTIIFRLCDSEMYTHMSKHTPSIIIDRGIALHKMIRLITSTLAGEGYLNFMGNEFGHPEWIDFPRDENGWSYHYCRRQWSLVDNADLRYSELYEFDRAMTALLVEDAMLERSSRERVVHQDDKVIVYTKGAFLFAYNFHPVNSYCGYFLPCDTGRYRVRLSSDCIRYGGYGRVATDIVYDSKKEDQNGTKEGFYCYLPSRTAIVFEKIKKDLY